MEKLVRLELTEDEFNTVVVVVWNYLDGSSSARTTLERKLDHVFKNTFGVDINDINPPGPGGGFMADIAQRNLSEWRKRRAAETAGAQTFTYHGVERVVKDVTVDSNRRLLSGFELYRDGAVSNQFKHFKLNEIG